MMQLKITQSKQKNQIENRYTLSCRIGTGKEIVLEYTKCKKKLSLYINQVFTYICSSPLPSMCLTLLQIFLRKTLLYERNSTWKKTNSSY